MKEALAADRVFAVVMGMMMIMKMMTLRMTTVTTQHQEKTFTLQIHFSLIAGIQVDAEQYVKEALAVGRVFAAVIGMMMMKMMMMMMMMMKKLWITTVITTTPGGNLLPTNTLLTHSWDPCRH